MVGLESPCFQSPLYVAFPVDGAMIQYTAFTEYPAYGKPSGRHFARSVSDSYDPANEDRFLPRFTAEKRRPPVLTNLTKIRLMLLLLNLVITF